MRLLAQLLVCILISTSTVAVGDDKKPIRALLITGGCCHDYDTQIKILKTGLGKHLNIDWTVKQYDKQRETRADIYDQPEWASDFDVIVHNECFGGVTEGDFVKSIVAEHVRSGVPAIVIHCSMHSYRNSPMADEWRQLIGVTSRRHERAKRSLDVVPQTPDNPIMKGFPNPWKTPNGELYIIERSWPNTKVLATAYSTEEKSDQPVVWTNEYKGVRVFGTTLGHHNETMEAEAWLQMTANGITWAIAQ